VANQGGPAGLGTERKHSVAVGREAAQTRCASPQEHCAKRQVSANSGDRRLEPGGDEAWVLRGYLVRLAARSRQAAPAHTGVQGSARARAVGTSAISANPLAPVVVRML